MKNLTAALCLITTCLLVLAILGQKSATATVSFVTDGSPTPTTGIDWSLVGQAIAAVISAIAGLLQLFRDFTAKPASLPGSQLIHDTIQHGGTLVPTAETLGDDIVAFTGQTGSGPAYELAMRVAAEKLLGKYTITRKP